MQDLSLAQLQIEEINLESLYSTHKHWNKYFLYFLIFPLSNCEK